MPKDANRGIVRIVTRMMLKIPKSEVLKRRAIINSASAPRPAPIKFPLNVKVTDDLIPEPV